MLKGCIVNALALAQITAADIQEAIGTKSLKHLRVNGDLCNTLAG
jgi:hypothetical protein